MATCLKRTSKLFDISLTRASANISLQDLICPVCRSILIEPVTLPCTHNLCLKCLKGTFEHNSLTCPLCRIRVGSWLRAATKTETLVNNGLWELIRTKFSKEVENKYNGDDRDIELDADYTGANKILSASGEIRREYEIQLRMVKEERECQRKVERMASEALIQKIQEEEQKQQLAQLTRDQILAKSLVKEQIAENHKEFSKCRNSIDLPNSSFHASKLNVATMTEVNLSKIEPHSSKYEKHFLESQDRCTGSRRTNVGLLSKIHAERYASNLKNVADTSTTACNETTSKFCCQKSIPIYNAVTKNLKNQTTSKIMESCFPNRSLEPKMSGSKIYGTRSKEELHIPNDIVNSKKKSLRIEVCISSGEDDERMGSAESAGSHDSINQEIHHFKPIKAMPRTPLKISTDGRQIDPKLIRVVPILKRIPNVTPKPPSQAHLKRIIGCSWSAFRGKAKQGSREKDTEKDEIERKASTSCNRTQITHARVTHENIKKIDFASELSFDHENYDKNVNEAVNGTKTSKREARDIKRAQKCWKSHVRNGMICKSKRQRSLWSRKDVQTATSTNGVVTRNSSPSSVPAVSCSPSNEEFEAEEEKMATMENIAERIKKRKTSTGKRNSAATLTEKSDPETIGKRSTRRRPGQKDSDNEIRDDVSASVQKMNRNKFTRIGTAKVKQRGIRARKQSRAICSERKDASGESSDHARNTALRKTSQRKLRYSSSCSNHEASMACEDVDSGNYHSSGSGSEAQEYMSENNNPIEVDAFLEKTEIVLSDDQIVKEQERMERLVIQEREDFELAQRLQAKFDEMERISGRTRRSRKAIENETIELDLYKIDIGKNVQRALNSHTAKTPIAGHAINTEAKKRGRPPKRIK